MKKNENNVTENIVIEPVMDLETMQAVIEDNMHFVPKNQLKRFLALPIEEQVAKMQYYQDRAAKIEEWKQSASVANRVKDLFEKKHGTVEDAKSIISWMQEFIDGYREREIARLDEEIARLEELKLNLA